MAISPGISYQKARAEMIGLLLLAWMVVAAAVIVISFTTDLLDCGSRAARLAVGVFVCAITVVGAILIVLRLAGVK